MEQTSTIYVVTTTKPMEVQMPSATTVRYAVWRVAEAMGYGIEDQEWSLFDFQTGKPMPEDDIIAAWDGKQVQLAKVRRGPPPRGPRFPRPSGSR